MAHLLAQIDSTPLERIRLKELCELALRCHERGFIPASSGNFSLRLRQEIAWMSPSGVAKRKLKHDQFIPLDVQSGEALIHKFSLVSEESPVHLAIYHFDPEARCVVHAHPPALVRKSIDAGKALVFCGDEMQKALGCEHFKERLEIKLAPNQQRNELRNDALALVRSYAHPSAKLVVLQGHGVYAWDKHPEGAMQRIEALEYLCQQ